MPSDLTPGRPNKTRRYKRVSSRRATKKCSLDRGTSAVTPIEAACVDRRIKRPMV